MSCKFNITKCSKCNNFNGCLLQVIYMLLLSMNDSLVKLHKQQEEILNDINTLKNNNMSLEDTIDITSDIDEVNRKISFISDIVNESDMGIDEINVDISELKSSLLTLDLKIDNIMKSVTYSLLN